MTLSGTWFDMITGSTWKIYVAQIIHRLWARSWSPQRSYKWFTSWITMTSGLQGTMNYTATTLALSVFLLLSGLAGWQNGRVCGGFHLPGYSVVTTGRKIGCLRAATILGRELCTAQPSFSKYLAWILHWLLLKHTYAYHSNMCVCTLNSCPQSTPSYHTPFHFLSICYLIFT